MKVQVKKGDEVRTVQGIDFKQSLEHQGWALADAVEAPAAEKKTPKGSKKAKADEVPAGVEVVA